MKNSALFLIGLFFIPSFLSAQSAKEKKVLLAVASLTKAMIDPDSSALYAMISPDLSYGHSGGRAEDAASFVRTLVSGKSDFVSIVLSGQSVSIHKKVAIVRHQLDAVSNDNGKPGEAHLFVLLVWHWERGGWKLLARQAVKRS